jgi:hypothetical protein
MNEDLFEIETIEPALQKFLFESPTPEEGVMVLLQNPQLLTDFVEQLFDSLINNAIEQKSEDLLKLYKGRRMLLRSVRRALSKKDLALLHAIKLMLLKKDLSAKKLSSKETEMFDFQEILLKVLVWLKAPTLEKGVSILQEYPELLTDRPIKMFGWLMEEAHKHGDDMFVQVLKTLREFFQSVRLTLMDKKGTTASQDEITQAVKNALKQIDFSMFHQKQEFSFFA